MNRRQQDYKRNRIKGMSQYNAARAAGYSETYSKQACRIEKLERVSMRDAFERAGITDKVISELAFNGLFAVKADGSPDWATRAKFLEIISKLSGREISKVEHFGMPETNIYVSPSKTYVFTSDPKQAGDSFRGVFDSESQEGITDTQ